MNELAEAKAFWDDFAKEYTDIQAESQIALVEDLTQYFQEASVFPAKTFLDLAGGSGKFIPTFESLVGSYHLVDFSKEMLTLAQKQYPDSDVVFIESDQNAFFAKTPDKSYDVVFSAMNPALTTAFSLNELLRITKKRAYILRLIEEKDALFSSLEEPVVTKEAMENYKKWLKSPYQSKVFRYHIEERIDKSFFLEYFEGEFSKEQLELLIKERFKDAETVKNQRRLTFELLSIKIED
ncbi:methyltransferase domain-containing protein [Enterococcus sp. LJL98]